ncbi:nucleotidyl transferase AbiEii/AbiGii toxin family protein [Candidatus Ruminimicrobium bovinum]|uniref:nucleotidyl transferase AbiEii/AbiGii toxin family protein n=1 Tax=Candidatus Ruminimicrobium bovinum TaxID=3242779 RepID=UPI0039B907CC
MTTDLGKSIIEQLKNKSKNTGISLQVYLQLFCQEEFLRRLSFSKYSNNFILKGGLFIYTLTNFESRVTIDIDFLLNKLSNSIETIKNIMEEIIKIETGNNYISFKINKIEIISPQRKYNGISCQLIGKIKNTKTPFNVDFGFGDVIFPKPKKLMINTQLKNFSKPTIKVYSIESTIAEKLDAIIQRFELSSRMKDYYDIYYLANKFDFNANNLKQAVIKTLKNRNSYYDKNTIKQIIELVSNKEVVSRWKNFCKKLQIKNLQFDDVIILITKFFVPIWNDMIEEKEINKTWNASLNKWI